MSRAHAGPQPARVYVVKALARRQQQPHDVPRAVLRMKDGPRVQPVVDNVAGPVPVTAGVSEFNEC